MKRLHLEDREQVLFLHAMLYQGESIRLPYEWDRLMLVDVNDRPVALQRTHVVHVLDALGLDELARAIEETKTHGGDVLCLLEGGLAVADVTR
jgi:hypothetical protein